MVLSAEHVYVASDAALATTMQHSAPPADLMRPAAQAQLRPAESTQSPPALRVRLAVAVQQAQASLPMNVAALAMGLDPAGQPPA